MMDIRCPNKLHAKLDEPDILEVACDSRWCGKKPGVVIIHRFRVATGELIDTLQFQVPHKPQRSRKEK